MSGKKDIDAAIEAHGLKSNVTPIRKTEFYRRWTINNPFVIGGLDATTKVNGRLADYAFLTNSSPTAWTQLTLRVITSSHRSRKAPED